MLLSVSGWERPKRLSAGPRGPRSPTRGVLPFHGMKIAIQGELGSFSHEAARRFHAAARVVPCATFARVFDLVVARSVDAGVIPIENTLAGSMAANLDLLLGRDVFVRRELYLPILRGSSRGRPAAAPSSTSSTWTSCAVWTATRATRSATSTRSHAS